MNTSELNFQEDLEEKIQEDPQLSTEEQLT